LECDLDHGPKGAQYEIDDHSSPGLVVTEEPPSLEAPPEINGSLKSGKPVKFDGQTLGQARQQDW
jgi:hypothetical protein